MTDIKIKEEKIYVTPLECTACRHEGRSNFIGAVYSLDKETNAFLCGKNLNYFCPEHHKLILSKSGVQN